MTDNSSEKEKYKDETRTFLNSIKQKVYELEKENKRYIYVYYSGKGWHKCGGISAQILFHVVASRTNGAYSPRLNPDKDFGVIFPTGVVSIRDMEKFRENMKIAGVKEDKTNEACSDSIAVFKLPEELREKDIQKLLKIDVTKKQQLADKLAIVHFDTGLAEEIRAMQRAVYPMVKKMSSVDKALVGVNFLNANTKMYMVYCDWANGEVGDEKGIKQMLQLISEMCGYMLIIMENNIIPVNDVASYTYRLEKMRAMLNKRKKYIEAVKT